MTEFNISRGLSTVLFTPEGDVNPDLLIEEGCWYICTDTAELFLGVQTDEGLTLKQVNDAESHPVVTEVKAKVETVVLPTLEKVETEIAPTVSELKKWVEDEEYLQSIDLSGYATEDFVNKAIAKAELGDTDIDLAGYATEDYVDEKIAAIKLPESEIYKVDFNVPNYAEAIEAYNNGKVLVLINAAPDINSYAVMNYVSDKYITFTKFLMSRSEAYGAFNTYYLGVDNTWEVSKEVRLNKVEANVAGEVNGELSTIRIGKEVYRIPTGGANIDLDNYYTKDEVDALIPDVDELATKEALQTIATDMDALAITTTKERYEVIRVPGLEVMHRDDEIRLNTEHVELAPQNVGDGGESNAYYVGINIYAPANAESIRQNITSTPGIQEGKEIVPFTTTDIDSYGRKYSTIWVKCAVYQNGAWLNYGMNSTSAKCLGYYYSVEWYDNNSNIIENDSIHVVFTNDACHYSNISDAVSRRFITVEEAIAAINIPEIPEIPDTTNFVTQEELGTVRDALNAFENTLGFGVLEDKTVAEVLDETFAKKTEIPSVTGFATEEYVSKKIAEAELADKEADLEAYYTKSEVDALLPEVPTKVSELENDAGYARKFVLGLGGDNQGDSWEVDISTSFEEFVQLAPAPTILYVGYNNDSKIYPARIRQYNSYHYEIEADVTKTTNISNFEVQPNKLQTWLCASISQPATGQWRATCFLRTFDMASVDYVNDKFDSITLPETDLSNYYNKSETETLVSEAVNGIEIPDTTGFITMSDVEGKGYITSEDIANKADKSELTSFATKEEVEAVEGKIPSLANYATKQDVADAVAGIEIPEVPEVNLENYHTKSEVSELLGIKANDIPFETAKFVTHAIGDFAAGDNVIGLTVAQIFAKLLGLVDEPGENPEEPDEPVIPEAPEELLDYLTENNASIVYVYDGNDVLTPTSFAEPAVWTISEAKSEMPGVNTAYKIADDAGNIIEAGYQQNTVYSDNFWATIALPSEITNITIKMYEPDISDWVVPNWTMVPAEEQTIEGHTIWAVPEEYEIDGGATYRFIIN